jgi:hypothetical protein
MRNATLRVYAPTSRADVKGCWVHKPRSLRIATVWMIAVTVVVATSGSALALGLGRSSGQKFKVGDACTMLKDSELVKAFKEPVTKKDYYLKTFACSYTLGADAAVAPGGQFTAYQLFPTDFEAASALFVVEDNHATESLSDEELVDVNRVGNEAYLNVTRNKIVVLATKKFAFELTWKPAPAGTPLSKAEIKQLKALAQKVVARVKH